MRRELRFKTFDDARAELTQLEKGPVETTGNWSYFQILNHCAKAMEGSMKGSKREIPWQKRYIFGPIGYWDTVLRGYIAQGIQGPKTERVEGDEKAALEQLRKAMDDFEKHEGPFSEHPRFGAFGKKKWYLFHSFHMANHLGWARPKT
jgi:hypothetical protein